MFSQIFYPIRLFSRKRQQMNKKGLFWLVKKFLKFPVLSKYVVSYLPGTYLRIKKPIHHTSTTNLEFWIYQFVSWFFFSLYELKVFHWDQNRRNIKGTVYVNKKRKKMWEKIVDSDLVVYMWWIRFIDYVNFNKAKDEKTIIKLTHLYPEMLTGLVCSEK